uniref:Uncharacterized protein n=1 Tax=Arundo donax TaxID=35708 RepID=A0A0A8ZRI2_ARUDO
MISSVCFRTVFHEG